MDKIIIGEKIRLRNKQLADARDDYKWQSNSELARLDAAPPLTISFAQFLLAYAEELRTENSSRRQFAIETLDGRHIGNCLYYSIDESKGEVELGVMIGDSNYWSKGYGTDAVKNLVNHIFSNTNLNRIYLKTLEYNRRAQRCFQKAGFAAYGRMAGERFIFSLMEVHRADWEKQNKIAEAKASTQIKIITRESF